MVYIHVPFCRSFCIYCDFYSELAARGCDGSVIENYVSGICGEIGRRRGEITAASGINTLYFGGGTPSVLPPSAFRRITDALDSGPFEEFTVEVNPDDIVSKGISYVEVLSELGVGRISMGVQSADDGVLRWMNRRHGYAEAAEAFNILREAGIANISLDLIFGISAEGRGALEHTLSKFCRWRPEHISAYQLGIEPETALYGMRERGEFTDAPDEECGLQYRLICETLAAEGYEHYEISNWALPGRRAIHNSAYWKRVPYVGLGPGAHSFLAGTRSWNSTRLTDWTSACEILSETEEAEERIMLGLRTSDGIPEEEFPERVREGLLGRMLDDGLLQLTASGNLRIPEERWFISDGIIASLI